MATANRTTKRAVKKAVKKTSKTTKATKTTPARRIKTEQVHTGRTTPKQDPNAPITSASEWKAASGVRPVPLTVPSGKTCLVKKPDGLEMFLGEGYVPNELMSIVQESIEGKTESAEAVASQVQDNPDMIKAMFKMIDSIVVHCVVEPRVQPVPVVTADVPGAWTDQALFLSYKVGEVIPPHLRPDDDALYVDYVDMSDRMFIFNYAVSGVTDFESFREEQNAVLASVLSSEDVGEDA